MPETSRSFNYWQAAPRWRPFPWLGNPGIPAMSTHAEGGKKQALVALIKEWKEREGQESPHSRKTLTLRKKLMPTKPLQCPMEQEHEECWCMRISNKPLTAPVKLVLLVVNPLNCV